MMATDFARVTRIDLEVVGQVKKLESVRPGLLRRLVGMFACNATQFLDGAPTAIAAGEFDALRMGYHSLKGTAAGLGACRLSDMAGAAEAAAIARAHNLTELTLALRAELSAVQLEFQSIVDDSV